jgi:hypothetical protein
MHLIRASGGIAGPGCYLSVKLHSKAVIITPLSDGHWLKPTIARRF